MPKKSNSKQHKSTNPNALHEAIQQNQSRLVKTLVDRQFADINAPHTETGLTPIEVAAAYGNVKAFGFLLARGASLDASQKSKNLLVHAGGSLAILNDLTDPLASLFEQFNDGTTDLHAAAIRGDIEYIRDVFEIEPERMLECTVRGEGILNWANYFLKDKVIQYLLDRYDYLRAMETAGSDDQLYDLARGHELMGDHYLYRPDQHELSILYYKLSKKYYQMMTEASAEYISEIKNKKAAYYQAHPAVQPAIQSAASAAAATPADLISTTDAWEAAWDDGSVSSSAPATPILTRQNACPDLTELAASQANLQVSWKERVEKVCEDLLKLDEMRIVNPEFVGFATGFLSKLNCVPDSLELDYSLSDPRGDHPLRQRLTDSFESIPLTPPVPCVMERSFSSSSAGFFSHIDKTVPDVKQNEEKQQGSSSLLRASGD